MKDPFNVQRKCMSCDCEYSHDMGAKHSTDIKEYVKFLGCCKEECFMKQPLKKRNRLMFGAFLSQFKK